VAAEYYVFCRCFYYDVVNCSGSFRLRPGRRSTGPATENCGLPCYPPVKDL